MFYSRQSFTSVKLPAIHTIFERAVDRAQRAIFDGFQYTLIVCDDDKRFLNDDAVVEETFERAGIQTEVEVHTGAAHGWCPPDSAVYNEPLAEKAWARLLELYKKAL